MDGIERFGRDFMKAQQRGDFARLDADALRRYSDAELATIEGALVASIPPDEMQVVLRWILQKGVPINTMSTKPENIRANYDVMDFILSAIDMARIDALTATGYRIIGKNLIPYAPDFD